MNDSTSYLIRNCKRGKQSSQIELYRRYAQKLYAACYRIVGNAPEAEEAMQDSFLKIFNRLDQYDETLNFEAWIHRIAVHTAIDYVRRQQPDLVELQENFVLTEEEPTEEEDIQYSVNRIKDATALLPTGYRLILSLHLFEGYDMEEISTILNIKPASVRSQFLWAKRKLVELLSAN